MIDEYFKEKAKEKKKQILLSWKKFYLDYNNEYQAGKVERQLERL
jgi:hypothetical protein